MPIGNRGLGGQPNLPYIDNRSYEGVDVFLDLTFLDHTGVPAAPTAVTYQVDDLTHGLNMIPSTSVPVFGNTTQTIQLPGAQMVLSQEFQGSQVCQVLITATLPDGSTIKNITVIEVVGIQLPTGS